MANYDEELEFAQNSDTGENEDAAVQPVGGSENVWHTTVNRPTQHLRRRTERIRQAIKDLNYFADYDRALVPHSTGKYALALAGTSPNRYTITPTADTWVYPALSPGRVSGGADKGAKLIVGSLPYVGVIPNELRIVASGEHTGQRGYANGESLATAGVLSVGANGITIELVPDAGLAGGPGSITATVTGVPARHIRIDYGTAAPGTTAAQLRDFINGDATSQDGGSYGLRHLIRASTTTGAGAFVSSLAPTKLQGGYDAEAHCVTVAQMLAFFADSADNWLQDGDGLAIGFPAGPVELGVGLDGGRRQALFDQPNDRIGGQANNTTPAVGYHLFNTRREPEKIPGSIPLGKQIGAEFVFTDGTRLPVGTALGLGESWVLLGRLGSTVDPTGASLVGYGGSGLWNANASGSPNPSLPASTVEAALDSIVDHLQTASTSNSGARRVGVETIAGVVSPGNLPLNLSAGSIFQYLSALLNDAPTSTLGGGVNSRVSERGHAMHGKNPIEKTFSETTPVDLSAGGGVFLRGVANVPGVDGAFGANHRYDIALQVSIPVTYDLGGDNNLNTEEPFTAGGAGYVTCSMNVAKAAALATILTAAVHTADAATDTYLVMAKVTGCSDATLNGWYYYKGVNGGTSQILLATLTGTFPTFTGTTGAITFYRGLVVGTDPVGHTVRGFHMGATDVPMVDLGTVGGTTPLMRFWDQDSHPDPAALFYSDYAVWHPTAATPRDTNNILGAADKSVLDGGETSTWVDGSTSHHHGGRYTRTEFLAAPAQSRINGVVSSADFTVLAVNSTIACVAEGTVVTAAGLGYAHARRGILARILVTMVTSAGASAGDRAAITLEFSDGAGRRYDVNVLVHCYAGGVNTLYQYVDVPLPVNGAAFSVTRRANALNQVTFTDASCGVTIHEQGQIVGF